VDPESHSNSTGKAKVSQAWPSAPELAALPNGSLGKLDLARFDRLGLHAPPPHKTFSTGWINAGSQEDDLARLASSPAPAPSTP
jgi:hypothetical protein